MRRVSCVLLPMLPLQIVVRNKPHWRGAPIAVVDDEGPNGRITHLNALAKKSRLRIGMRQTVARDLLPSLHTTVVSSEETAEVSRELLQALQTFSPRVEPLGQTTGAFHIDPEGLRRLYGGYRNWATCIHRYLRARQWQSSVTVGFHRHRALAVAMTHDGVTVVESREQELEQSNQTPLREFGLPGELCESLTALGIETLGDFLVVPAGELHSRFGSEASALHDLFAEDLQLPIQPHAFDEPARISFQVDPPDEDQTRLLFAIKGALHSLLHQVRARGDAVQSLELSLHLERAPLHREHIEPASPTLDLMLILELIRLRFGEASLQGAVEEVELLANTVRADAEQVALPGHQARRDMGAAHRALDRIRAAYGEHSVTKAAVREAHLPEASFRWEPIQHARIGNPESAAPISSMIRRVYARPKPLPPRVPKEPEAGPSLNEDHSIEHMYGPYRVSGGWWKRLVERDYYYAETDHGDLLWLFYDRPRKRWFLHGVLD
ncbi:MAG: DNA polymerase Y family protein [Myxococcales bacterium]|nr:MAG: DNA polymerase Y family protein [Myxococcales bacterium]